MPLFVSLLKISSEVYFVELGFVSEEELRSGEEI
jgi:hypothetical protein